jgi:hypothetical protein
LGCPGFVAVGFGAGFVEVGFGSGAVAGVDGIGSDDGCGSGETGK